MSAKRPPVALGTVVAERIMILEPGGTVAVRIGLPFAPEGYPGESRCPWQIEGIGDGRVRATVGVDSAQALWLAFQRVGAELYESQEYRDGRLKAFAGEEGRGDLGFPVPSNFEDMLPASR